jgi:ribosomal protein S27AE
MKSRTRSESACPHCGETLRLNYHYPVLTKEIALVAKSAEEIDRLRYVAAWVCDRCSYSKILERSDKSA